jgi:glycosyltransferase involved in cell wall biosynthesis
MTANPTVQDKRAPAQAHPRLQHRSMANTAYIIPTLDPDANLPSLVAKLLEIAPRREVIVVNDGSGSAADPIFSALRGRARVTVLEHNRNLGKGRALKTAFRHYLETRADGVGAVTADSDGQHAPADVAAVAAALEANPASLVVGVRDFSRPGVPFRSRFGNRLTSRMLRCMGLRLSDTQSGLRGVPARFMRSLLDVPGERFEFETAMLLEAGRAAIPVIELPIATIYRERNRSSHFKPLLDSLRIYRLLCARGVRQFGLFAVSALLSAGLDLLIFALLFHRLLPALGLPRLIGATIVARLVSAYCNYSLNRRRVFLCPGGWLPDGRSLSLYTLLCAALMLSSYFGVRGLLSLLPRANVVLLKAGVDLALFIISFTLQKFLVFRAPAGKSG